MLKKREEDMVNSPKHYNFGKIEVIDMIEQIVENYPPEVAYHIGACLKYIARAPFKNGLQDLEKEVWYMNRAIKLIKEENLNLKKEKEPKKVLEHPHYYLGEFVQPKVKAEDIPFPPKYKHCSRKLNCGMCWDKVDWE